MMIGRTSTHELTIRGTAEELEKALRLLLDMEQEKQVDQILAAKAFISSLPRLDVRVAAVTLRSALDSTGPREILADVAGRTDNLANLIVSAALLKLAEISK